MSLPTEGIHSVPVEILIQILLLCVTVVQPLPFDLYQYLPLHQSLPSLKPYYSRLSDLSLVCKHWGAVLEGYPLVWTKISSKLPAPIVSQLLLRSGTSPLDVIYWSNGEEDTWLTDQLAPYLRRVQNFVLMADKALPRSLLRDLVGTSLQTLYIHRDLRRVSPSTRATLPASPAPTLDAELPQLRRLVHRGEVVSLNWAAISNLTHLEIRKYQVEMLDTEDWLLRVLRNNPMLASLTLEEFKFHGGNTEPFPSSTSVQLNHLSTLRLAHNDNAFTRRILSTIVAPVCSELFVAYKDVFLEDAAVTSEHDPFQGLDDLASIVLHQPHSRVAVGYNNAYHSRLSFKLDGRPVLGIECERGFPRHIHFLFDKLLSYLPGGGDAVSECYLSSNSGFDYKENLWWPIASLPNIASLEVATFNSQKPVDLLMKSPPLLPQLKILRLDIRVPKNHSYEFMVPVLRYRNAAPTLAALEQAEFTVRGGPLGPPADLKEALRDARLIWARGSILSLGREPQSIDHWSGEVPRVRGVVCRDPVLPEDRNE